MKVIFTDQNITNLTHNKEYEVTDNGDDHYQVIDDLGEKIYHPKVLFTKVFAHIEEVVGEEYDMINPKHYQTYDMETIDMMVAVWGGEATAKHCQMCAFKYRMRLGSKPNNSIEQDLKKANWYEDKAKELREI